MSSWRRLPVHEALAQLTALFIVDWARSVRQARSDGAEQVTFAHLIGRHCAGDHKFDRPSERRKQNRQFVIEFAQVQYCVDTLQAGSADLRDNQIRMVCPIFIDTLRTMRNGSNGRS